ncbi:MAG: cupin domain-containing protein [Nitrososphaerales archaeon]
MPNVILKKDQKILSSKLPGRKRVFLIGMERGAKFLKADLFTYSPLAESEEHFHTTESFTYIIEGKCEMLIDGTKYKLGKQSAVLLNAKERHNVKNTGKKKMVMLEVYGPLAEVGTVWSKDGVSRGWVNPSSKS